MTSIITGDIINSRSLEPNEWMPSLKEVLNLYGTTPQQWEVYRGDSFQLEVPPEKALEAAILIKASLKQFKKMDARMAIGIGEKNYTANKITESNGTAFINSGKCFEQLKKNTLAIQSTFPELDHTLNIMFDLALLTMNNWTPTSARLLRAALEHPNMNQIELAEIFSTTQGNISQGLKRAGHDEITKLINYYKSQITQL
ncbi:transcriptional regulator [Mangrovimonas xylaniphaga]|uniref:transcriptional regulator n=1 Tax=Mangrovimonas xylaniphaga TaxID=1645915 RepID=UPI0006B6615C|nr:transcriptional regulator [Mangrovimonas xylaniphaga]